jgi:hypothetical protein
MCFVCPFYTGSFSEQSVINIGVNARLTACLRIFTCALLRFVLITSSNLGLHAVLFRMHDCRNSSFAGLCASPTGRLQYSKSALLTSLLNVI